MPRKERFIPPPMNTQEPERVSLPTNTDEHGAISAGQLVVPTHEEVRVPPSVTPVTGDSTTANPSKVSEDHFAAVEWGSPEPETQVRMPTAEEIDRDGRRAAAILRHRAKTRRRPNR